MSAWNYFYSTICAKDKVISTLHVDNEKQNNLVHRPTCLQQTLKIGWLFLFKLFTVCHGFFQHKHHNPHQHFSHNLDHFF